MNSILIATDGSKGAECAVREGVALAAEVGAEVIFVTVRSRIYLLGEPWYQQQLTRQLAEARAALDEAEGVARQHGVLYDSEILEGDAAPMFARSRSCARQT